MSAQRNAAKICIGVRVFEPIHCTSNAAHVLNSATAHSLRRDFRRSLSLVYAVDEATSYTCAASSWIPYRKNFFLFYIIIVVVAFSSLLCALQKEKKLKNPKNNKNITTWWKLIHRQKCLKFYKFLKRIIWIVLGKILMTGNRKKLKINNKRK